MKKYLVELNRPLVIKANDYNNDYYTLYGFLAPYDDDQEKNEETKRNFLSYIYYLAGLHEYSNASVKPFSIGEDGCWVDGNGEGHRQWDSLMEKIGGDAAKNLGLLDYSIYLVDLDRSASEGCVACGVQRNCICCEMLMNTLLNNALELKKNKLYDAVLFNKPIWLPVDMFRPGEPGHLSIYGILSPVDVDRYYLNRASGYLGYLAMYQEYEENGETPSGLKAINGDPLVWEDGDGELYDVKCSAVHKECDLCREKNNLKITKVAEDIPLEEINYGVYEGFIISHELYEHLLENSTKIGS